MKKILMLAVELISLAACAHRRMPMGSERPTNMALFSFAYPVTACTRPQKQSR